MATSSTCAHGCADCAECASRSPLEPVRYVCDRARHRIVVTMVGEVAPFDFVQILERQWHERRWSFGLIYDLRRATTEWPLFVQRQFLAHSAPTPQTARARGPVAFVVLDAALYKSTCSYIALTAGAHQTMAVFRDVSDAHAWIDQMQRERRPDAADARFSRSR